MSIHKFDIIVLGNGGGIDESNLSSFLISACEADRYICFDAGSLMHGLKLAAVNGHFDHLHNPKLKISAHVLINHIDAYCISHPHLDHIAGMLIVAPLDSKKTIFGSHTTIENLNKHVFFSPIWGDFTTQKNKNGKWDLKKMDEKQWYTVENNALKIKYYPLTHGKANNSSAFLIEHLEEYMLFFGDTGSDRIQKTDNIEKIFKEISPLIRQKKLKAVFIESSFSNNRKDDELYGHMKPSLIEEELHKLAIMVDKDKHTTALKGLKILITHIKPDCKKEYSATEIIIKEINKMKSFGAEIIITKQSEKYKI
jgi:3',5'-cyclic-nucleotide phosphodiesterase